MSFILKSISGKTQLRWLIIIFFLLLALPSSFLIYSSLEQLKWQQIYQYQKLADEFNHRIDNEFKKIFHKMEALSIDDFNFLKFEGDEKHAYLQRTLLSAFPVNMHDQGVTGYFQVDNEGRFSTPLLPDKTVLSPTEYNNYPVPGNELIQRTALEDKLFEVLLKNQLIQTDMKKYAIKVNKEKFQVKKSILKKLKATRKKQPELLKSKLDRGTQAEAMLESEEPRFAPQSQSAFDSLGKSSWKESTDKLNAKQELSMRTTPGKVSSGKTVEKTNSVKKNLFEHEALANKNSWTSTRNGSKKQHKKAMATRADSDQINKEINPDLVKHNDPKNRYRIKIFETEIEPFELARLETGELVLFRKAWREKSRLIQGMIIDPDLFFKKMIADDFNHTALAELGELTVYYANEKLAEYNNDYYNSGLSAFKQKDKKFPEFKHNLSPPFSPISLVYHLRRIPIDAGASVIYMVAGIFMVVLVLGFMILYRLLIKQLDLAQQQQDFVSSVSHELKTPLTSIRMYGEMLLQNWVSEHKKKSYYQYIFDESERLSRLINNVLQLSSISRDTLQLNVKPNSVSELIDLVQSKVISQVENSGYKLNVIKDNIVEEAVIEVDVDAFIQIIINLVDNGIKFSTNSNKKQIDILCTSEDKNRIRFSVRDYGQGIASDKMKKIFQLFYRLEDEITRETVGTGIGLSLVRSLASAMEADIDVKNSNPGAEFSICFIILP